MEEINKILDKINTQDQKFKEDLTKSLQSTIIKQMIIANTFLFILVLISISRWFMLGN